MCIFATARTIWLYAELNFIVLYWHLLCAMTMTLNLISHFVNCDFLCPMYAYILYIF